MENFYKLLYIDLGDDIYKNYGNKQGMERIKKYTHSSYMHCRSLAFLSANVQHVPDGSRVFFFHIFLTCSCVDLGLVY